MRQFQQGLAIVCEMTRGKRQRKHERKKLQAREITGGRRKEKRSRRREKQAKTSEDQLQAVPFDRKILAFSEKHPGKLDHNQKMEEG